MKKTIFSILLVITLLLASVPVAFADAPEKILASDYDYSFIVTVNSPTQRTFSLSDFEELPEAEGLTVFRKTKTQEGYTYEMVIVDRSQLAVDSMEAVKNNPLVSAVSRNIHAKDYNEKASTITLSETVINIPVGGTATVNVVDTDFKEGANRYRSLAIQIDLDPQVMSFEDLQLMATRLSGNPNEATFKCYAMYEEDSDYIEQVHEPWLVYKQSYDGFGEKSYDSRLNTPSPIHRYMIANMLESEVSNEEFIQHFIDKEGVQAACLVYVPLIGAMAPFETWELSNDKIASIDVTAENSNGLNSTVTITGKQKGSTVLWVTRGEGLTTVTSGCFIYVYDADDDTANKIQGEATPTDVTPTDLVLGDVTDDRKVDAKDALEVLKASVKKVELTPLQALAAEVDGIEGIGARDALEILKYTVKKIDKFPIQQGAETPTDITPTDGE